MSMPHSLNCSNLLVVSGLGAIGNYRARIYGCLCSAGKLRPVSPTSLFQGVSQVPFRFTECKSHFVNDTIIIMSPNFAEFLLDTTNNGNEILAVLEDIVEVTETGGTDL